MINLKEFKIPNPPILHPASQAFATYWREQKRRCIEGYWVSGKWMPGKLYFYINFGTIKLNKRGSKVKSFGRPFLRDLEWEFFYNWCEARGFSGFADDTEFTCYREINNEDYPLQFKIDYAPDAFKPDGTPKTYISTREYLRKVHPTNLGRPLFQNEAKDFMMMGCYQSTQNVKMYDGTSKNIVDVEEGDLLLGKDEVPRKVKQLIRGPHAQFYKIKQRYGEDYEVTGEHKLVVSVAKYSKKDKKLYREEKIIKAKDLYEEKLKGKEYFKVKYKGIKRPAITHWKSENLLLDPYYLGLWVGDGTKENQIITNSDPEIFEWLEDYSTKVGAKFSYYHNSNKKYEHNKDVSQFAILSRNEFNILGRLKEENLLRNKHIPKKYLRSSYEDRLKLLAGLIDSDGNIQKGRMEYTFYQNNKELIVQVKELVLSLGLTVTNEYHRKRTTKTGKVLDEYRITFTGEAVTQIPCQVPRKQRTKEQYYSKSRKDYNLIPIDIEETSIEPFYGVEVDGDHIHCLNDYTLSHNSRGFGKSYSVGVGIVAHEWLFNGSTHYTEESRTNPTAAEIVVGAGDAKYSRDILDKTKIAIEKLPGASEFGGVSYPSPFAQQYSGSWMPGSQVIASYKEKIGGNWAQSGSQSNIKHRTFRDNPFAANGTRPGVMVMEEIGMFDNLRESRAASVECMRDGHYKFGSCMYLGTGGDMNGGGTIDASLMFYDPEKYDLVPFHDEWEHRGQIGYFVPAYLGLNAFKKEVSPGVFGETDVMGAKKFLATHRDKLRGTKTGSDALDAELQNRPVMPSEIFLTKTGNIFPVADLQNRLRLLEQHDRYSLIEKKVELYYDKESAYNGVDYSIDTKEELVNIDRHPWTEGSREGCVVIYELPQLIDGKVPEGAYIIGHDPYATDDPSGGSLAATYVLKTNKYFNKIGHNEIVAQYVGRPHAGRHVYNENLLKLSLFYGNAKVYFENVRGNVKEYFEKKKKLHLLAKEPQTLFNKKAVYDTKQAVIYGFPMSSKKMKQEAIQYVRDWLLEERGVDSSGKMHRNLDRIWDRAFLQELIAFNYDGNFDRVSGFVGCVLGLEEITNQKHIRATDAEMDDPLKFLLENNNLFNRKKF